MISIGRTSILLAASLCCMQLAIAEEATTQNKSETNSSNQASTVPVKPLQAECDKLLSAIRSAEKDGIETKTYLNLYKDIELSMVKGEQMDQIRDRLNRLSKALEEQISMAKILRTKRTIVPYKVAGSDVDFGPYMADLQRRIKRCWSPPKGNESKKIVVKFKLFRDGSIKYLRILQTSEIETADNAALKAVESAAPFQNLPNGAPSDVDIEFSFDYNVFNPGHTALPIHVPLH